MAKIITASQAKANIYNLMNEVAQTHEPIIIKGKNNNIVMISRDDWDVIEETLYLNSIQNTVLSLQDAMNKMNDEVGEKVIS